MEIIFPYFHFQLWERKNIFLYYKKIYFEKITKNKIKIKIKITDTSAQDGNLWFLKNY